jgi:hypothetical protein
MSSSPRFRRGRSAPARCAVVALAAFALAAAAPARAADVKVYPPGSEPFGKTYGEWSAAWWKQAARQTGAPGSPFAAGRVDCSAMGTRDVVFLVGTTTTSPVERSCRVAGHAAILLPVINAECSEAEGNGSTKAALRACAAGLAGEFTDLHLSVDGKRVKRLSRFRFTSPLFRFSPVTGNVFGIPAATRSPSVADGYWVMLKRLGAGTHTVSFGGEAPKFDFSTHTTYALTVR